MAAALELVKQRIDEAEAKITEWELQRGITMIEIPLFVVGLDKLNK